MPTLILLRHGQSRWNLEDRFTGWVDVDLTPEGEAQATKGGELIKAAGIQIDRAFTSVLTRAIRTCWLALTAAGQVYVPETKDWRLNERHYGGLTGLDKAETATLHGADQVKIWRRSYDIPPPALEFDDPRHPRFDARYGADFTGIAAEHLPKTECLKDTVARFVPYWEETIAPVVKSGKSVIVAAHGNSIRALIKYLDNISDEDIVNLNIPTGIPLVYEFNDDMTPIRSYYLGDEEAAKAAAAAVANQAKGK